MSERAFDLAALGTHELAELGARVRRCSDGRHKTFASIAECVVETLWRAFARDLMPPLALLRAYRIRKARRVEPRSVAEGDAKVDEGIEVVASRGVEEAWNEPAGREELAVVTGLADEVRADFTDNDNVIWIEDAIGSRRLPAQRELVLRYGVRSVVGWGGGLPDGTSFAVVVFSRVAIGRERAAAFTALVQQTGLALLDAEDVTGRTDAARARALERLLRSQEYVFVQRAAVMAAEAAELRQHNDELARSLAVETSANHKRIERTQRGMLNVIEDLREARTELEQRVIDRTAELARANADLRTSNTELEQFAYIASHDLQEPLRTIAGYLQLLEERYGEKLDAEAIEFIDFAVRGAHRMQELIDALLAYSRVARAPIDLGEVPLDEALDEALQAMERSIAESGAQIERAPLPVVRGDAIQLRQLFQNLVSNAIKFAGEQPPRIEIAAERSPGEVALSVRDQGLGFDPKYADQIFKVFRRLQRKQPGTGIGLAICKKIAERHGGSIRATSSPGAGATFVITLPTFEGI